MFGDVGIQEEGGHLAPTELQRERARCIGQQEQARRMNFEKRVKEIMQMKSTGQSLSNRVIETWINETLSDAEHLDIPGVILKPSHKQPLNRYQIDKLYLNSSGVPFELIDRVYRGLFVYSIGFYEMVHKCFEHAKNKYTLISAVWKVYSILLEYCCKSNYQMLIAKISNEHQSQMEKMEEDFLGQIRSLNQSEKELKQQVDMLSEQNALLKKQLQEETELRSKLQEEMSKSLKTHEEEVQLRLQFESKLNGLHSLHRDLQAKYERAIQDIYNLENLNRNQKQKIDDQAEELIELRSSRIENEARITYQNERIKSLQTENEQKVRQIAELEGRLLKAHETIEESNLKVKTAEQHVSQMKLIQESEKALINGLSSEKRHLELTLKENISLKDQYKDKCDSLQEMYENLFKETQNYKRQLVGIEEIKKDRDDRIGSLRKEIDELTEKLDAMEKDHSKITIKYKSLYDEHERTEASHQTLSANLSLANKVRQEAEENLSELQQQYQTVKEAFVERDRLLTGAQKKYEQTQQRLTEVEKQCDMLELAKKSLVKQNEIQRKQLLDKIAQQNEQVAAEKDTREIWINRYEKEQRAHIQTHTDYMVLRGQYQELSLKFDNQKTVVETLEQAKGHLTHQLAKIQTQHTVTQAETEKLRRDLFTKERLLEATEIDYKQKVDEVRTWNKTSILQQRAKLEAAGLQYEDLRTHAYMQYEKIQAKIAKIKSLKSLLDEEREEKERQTHLFKLKSKECDDLWIRLDDKDEELKKQRLISDGLRNDIRDHKHKITELQQTIENLLNQILELKNQLLSNEDRLHEMQEKIDRLESLRQHLEDRLARKEKVRYNRGIQTKRTKQKEIEIQTDFVQLAPAADKGFGSRGYQSETGDQQTEMSTNNHSTVPFAQRPPRVMSANQSNGTGMHFGPHGSFSGVMSYKGPSQPELNSVEGPQILQRPTKSAVNKYRHLTGDAIQEEDYANGGGATDNMDEQKYIRESQRFFKNGMMHPDDESIQDAGVLHPMAMRIHKQGRRSHVRLKHGNKTNQQSMHNFAGQLGIGVLLGNYRSTESQKELQDFAPENLKSVYNMRVSHSNMQTRPMSQPRGNKRQYLQSAVTRTGAPHQELCGSAIDDQLSDNNSGDQPGSIVANRNHTYTKLQSYNANSLNSMGYQTQVNVDSSRNSNLKQGQSKSLVPNNIMQAPRVKANLNVRIGSADRNARSHSRSGPHELEMQVKGNSSIRTLIRLANQRQEQNNKM